MKNFKKQIKLLTISLFFLLPAIIPSLAYGAAYTYAGAWSPTYGDGIAIDSSGNLFIVAKSISQIYKLDSNGNVLATWGSNGNGDGQFSEPSDIAVDSSGNFYVADNWNHRIQKFDSNGNFITKWGSNGNGDGQFSYPAAIAIDPLSNNVYVDDGGNNRIQKFDSNGNYLSKWSVAVIDLDYLSAIAADSAGNIYVAISGVNLSIQKFDSNGNFLTSWGSTGSGDGQFYTLVNLATDHLGNVYTSDYNNRIQKFDSNGNFLTKWGDYGSGNGQFNWPQAIAVSPTYQVYVYDYFNERFQKFVDSTLPTDPTSISSTSHTVNTASADNTVDIAWSGASDDTGGSGLAGFSYEWSQAATTLPDNTRDIAGTISSTTSSALAEGSNYFHLRTADNAGNWTSTVHLGPFIINTTGPKTYAKSTTAKKGKKAKLKWKAEDTIDTTANVTIKIQKKIKSKALVKKKAKYLKLYKALKKKAKKAKGKKRRTYLSNASKYLKLYKKTKVYIYQVLKNAKYGTTSINTWKTYIWNAKKPGKYEFLVYAKDGVGNEQQNVAKGKIIVK